MTSNEGRFGGQASFQNNLRIPTPDHQMRLRAQHVVQEEGIRVLLCLDGENPAMGTAREGYQIAPNLRKAALETTALMLKYPQLLYTRPQFSSLRRLIRFDELEQQSPFGPTSLFIGSGSTISEVAALYVQPASPDEEQRVFSTNSRDSFTQQVSQMLTAIDSSGQYPTVPVLREGPITVIEPDSRSLSYLAMEMTSYGIHADKFEGFFQNTLQDVYRTRLRANHFDNIILQRAEPTTLARVKKGSLQLDRVLIDGVMKSLKTGGKFVLTVGMGPSPAELSLRIDLMRQMAKYLTQTGFTMHPGIELIFQDRIQRLLLSSPSFGAIGGLIATKT